MNTVIDNGIFNYHICSCLKFDHELYDKNHRCIIAGDLGIIISNDKLINLRVRKKIVSAIDSKTKDLETKLILRKANCALTGCDVIANL